MFRLSSTYVSTYPTEIGCVSSVLDLRLDRARPMFRLCSNQVSTLSTKTGCVSNVLDLCFNFFDQKLVCDNVLTKFWYVLTFSAHCRHVSIFSTKSDMFRLSRLNKKARFCSTQFRYVSTLSTKTLSVWKFKTLGF